MLTNYNNAVALHLALAGQMLLQDGLFTAAQLGAGNALGYNNPNSFPVNRCVPSLLRCHWLRQADQSFLAARSGSESRLSYKIREGIEIQPSAGFYNLFNFADFDLPGTALSGLLTGAAGQINGTAPASHNVDRVGVGTGVYSLGAPRQIEFGLRIIF